MVYFQETNPLSIVHLKFRQNAKLLLDNPLAHFSLCQRLSHNPICSCSRKCFFRRRFRLTSGNCFAYDVISSPGFTLWGKVRALQGVRNPCDLAFVDQFQMEHDQNWNSLGISPRAGELYHQVRNHVVVEVCRPM